MNKARNSSQLALVGLLSTTLLVVAGCDSNDDESSASDMANTGGTPDTSDTASAGTINALASCEEIAAVFQTNGSANADLPDPEASAVCVDNNVIVSSNGIPDFPYIVTSPGNPEAIDQVYTLPATPLAATTVTDIPAIGAIGVAVNGIPIFGATEGTGGDVFSLTGGFTECGGHNGPTGYHYHTFDPTGSDVCRFSEAEAIAEPQLFGYAFDGYPIYSGNFQFTSSWSLTDVSLFATDTFSAHTFTEGSGDLDQCNGRFDSDGNYAYYTTEDFPYTLGCYSGVVEVADETDRPQGPGGPGGPGQ